MNAFDLLDRGHLFLATIPDVICDLVKMGPAHHFLHSTENGPRSEKYRSRAIFSCYYSVILLSVKPSGSVRMQLFYLKRAQHISSLHITENGH